MSDPTTQHRKVLVLCSPNCVAHRALLDLLPAGSLDIREVHNFQEAVGELRKERFDLVISEQSDFVALERACVTQQSAVIIETLGQGVCIVDTAGRVVWANPRMRAHPQELIDSISENCRRALASQDHPPRSRHFSFSTSSDLYFEITATPMLDEQHRAAQMVAVAWDVTHMR